MYKNSKGFSEGDVIIEVDSRYFRPTEVAYLLGDATKARTKLNWRPEISIGKMVREMVAEDIEEASRDKLVKESGFSVNNKVDE